jgi:hypothetical protein
MVHAAGAYEQDEFICNVPGEPVRHHEADCLAVLAWVSCISMKNLHRFRFGIQSFIRMIVQLES